MNDHLAKLVTEKQWVFIRTRTRQHLSDILLGNHDEDTIDELAQVVLQRLLQRMDSFDSSDPDVLVYMMLNWTHRASRLVVLEYLREKRRSETRSTDIADMAEASTRSSMMHCEHDWPVDRSIISSAVESLPMKIRIAVLGWMNSENIEELAERMACRPATVRTYVSRGLSRLSKSLKRKAH